MGRIKRNMKQIESERSRLLTYEKRRKGLTKKIYELTTLCGIDACMICFGPVGSRSYGPQTWPETDMEVKRVIERYLGLNKEEREKRNLNLSSFFEDKKKVEEKEEKAALQYPSWDEDLDNLSEETLRGLVRKLDSKLEIVRKRIESINGEKCVDLNIPSSNHLLDASNQKNDNGMYVIRRQPLPISEMRREGIAPMDMIQPQPLPISYIDPSNQVLMAPGHPYYPMMMYYPMLMFNANPMHYGDFKCSNYNDNNDDLCPSGSLKIRASGPSSSSPSSLKALLPLDYGSPKYRDLAIMHMQGRF